MNLTDYFNRHFEIVSADTDPLIEEVFRLRYQVYCVENALADRRDYSDLKEGDSYDAHSIHKLIRHKTSGIYVASVRFILTDPSGKETKFPLELFCGHSFYKNSLLQKKYKCGTLAEVSRFLVSRERERQIIETSSSLPQGVGTKSICKSKSGLICYLLLFGLISAVIRTATEKKLPYWYVCIEPRLWRLFRMLGISFIRLGPAVEYHGKRIPCLGSTDAILSGIRQYRPELHAFVTQKDPFGQHLCQTDSSVVSSNIDFCVRAE